MTDIVANFWSLGVRPEPGKGLQVICEGFRASDGYVVAQVVREHQFWNLGDLVGHPEWRDDPRFATRAGWGPALESEIRPAVDAWASTRTKLEAARELTEAGVVAGPSNHAADVIADPHVSARHMLVEMPRTDGVAEPVLVPGNPVKLSKVSEGPENAGSVGRRAHRGRAVGRARLDRRGADRPARARRHLLIRRGRRHRRRTPT